MRQTTVATFSDLEKAREITKALSEAGIPAQVNDESNWQKFWFLSKPLAGEHVVVDEKDFDRARQVLKAADDRDHILQGEVRCAKCGSAEIEYPQFTRKFMTTTCVEVLCFLRVLDKQFYCNGCHHTWPVSETLRAKTDILNWPQKRDGLVKNENA